MANKTYVVTAGPAEPRFANNPGAIRRRVIKPVQVRRVIYPRTSRVVSA